MFAERQLRTCLDVLSEGLFAADADAGGDKSSSNKGEHNGSAGMFADGGWARTKVLAEWVRALQLYIAVRSHGGG
jgi:hypothetical protein